MMLLTDIAESAFQFFCGRQIEEKLRVGVAQRF